MHRARCGLLFNATALPLRAAAAPFPCKSIRWETLGVGAFQSPHPHAIHFSVHCIGHYSALNSALPNLSTFEF